MTQSSATEVARSLDRAVGNFRVNIFRQRGTISLVIRYVRSNVPPFDQLKLPSVLLDLVTAKRGRRLVTVVFSGHGASGGSCTTSCYLWYRKHALR